MANPLGPGPLIYGHRGAKAHARDNTIRSFELAVEHGADGVELDVQPTKDWKLVVTHDEHHPDAGWIAECYLSDLRRIDPEIPTLDEVFDVLAGRIFVNVEIKNSPIAPTFDRHRRLAELVPPVIAAHGMDDAVIVSSFDAVTVRRVRDRAPQLRTGQLFVATDPRIGIEWAARDGISAANIHRSWPADDPGIIGHIHDLGLAACIWTVDDTEEVRALAVAGADVIITDDPRAAKSALSG